jgi:hypothetical protein
MPAAEPGCQRAGVGRTPELAQQVELAMLQQLVAAWMAADWEAPALPRVLQPGSKDTRCLYGRGPTAVHAFPRDLVQHSVCYMGRTSFAKPQTAVATYAQTALQRLEGLSQHDSIMAEADPPVLATGPGVTTGDALGLSRTGEV